MLKFLFVNRQFHSDEDFKLFLKKKNKMLLGLSFSGLLLLLTFFVASQIMKIELSDHLSGFYSGVGGALIFAGLAIIVKNRRLMNNPELLRKTRIKNSDERNIEISAKSFRIAGFVQFLASYCLSLIGPFVNPLLSTIGLILIYIFLFSYLISYFILNRKL